MKSLLWFVPSFFVFLGILLLSTAFSFPIQPKGFSYLDKWEHAFAYFTLITSLLFGFHKSSVLSLRLWLWLMLGCAAYGTFLEYVQFAFFPDRFFEWLDAGANIVGVILGGGLFGLIRKYV